jgi:hypothetical protein
MPGLSVRRLQEPGSGAGKLAGAVTGKMEAGSGWRGGGKREDGSGKRLARRRMPAGGGLRVSPRAGVSAGKLRVALGRPLTRRSAGGAEGWRASAVPVA